MQIGQLTKIIRGLTLKIFRVTKEAFFAVTELVGALQANDALAVDTTKSIKGIYSFRRFRPHRRNKKTPENVNVKSMNKNTREKQSIEGKD
ncbi:MAG: hypothetical protein QXV37_03060 [Candidatus Jordarchaeaceae archaeon]